MKTEKGETTCKFEIVHRDSQILLDQSSVSCTPTLLLPVKSLDVRVMGSSGLSYTADIQISPDVLIDIVVGRTINSTFRYNDSFVCRFSDLRRNDGSVHFN